MAVHQYIGARYVPYFYKNSLDPTSTDWEPNVIYEPLTVVTLTNDHTYISKKTVPASVGSPALNPEYWLDQGSYNAYIQDLQDQIDAITGTDIPAIYDDIKEHMMAPLSDRKLVVIGDSYNSDYMSGGVQIYGWSHYLASQNGITIDAGDNYGVSGTGFLAPSETMAWKAWVDSHAVDNDVTDVVICGGDNDIQYALQNAGSDLVNAIKATLSSVKTKFPKAKIWVGFVACDLNGGMTSQTKACFKWYAETAVTCGAQFIPGVSFVLYDRAMMLNNSHPNNGGNAILAGAIATGICGGKFIKNKLITTDNPDFTDPSCQGTFCHSIDFWQTDNIISLHSHDSKGFGAVIQPWANYYTNGSTLVPIAKFNNLPFPAEDTVPLYAGSGVAEFAGVGWVNVTVTLVLWHGFLEAGILYARADGGGYLTDTLKQFTVGGWSAVVDLMRGVD